MDEYEQRRFSEELNWYTNEWVRRNIGDPEKYELTPEQYGHWLMREAGEVMDEYEQRRFTEELNLYTNEWVRRNIGDPEKYELTPEQYGRWLMREAGEGIDEDEAVMIVEELKAYAAEWSRQQSEKKVIKYLEPTGGAFRRRPRANNAQQPVRLGGFYGFMP